MHWELEIHHIDLQRSGDSTIVIVRNNGNIQKTVLIDGGKAGSADIIHNYLTTTIGVARVDVIIVTHYDEDHFAGIHTLLQKQGTTLYDNAIIYDLGKPPNDDKYFRRKTRRKRQADGTTVTCLNHPDTDYTEYIDAIATKPNIIRATTFVNSFYIVEYDVNNLAIIPYPANYPNYLLPYWLVGKELMWGNGGDSLNGRPAFNSAVPANAPKITCIAANKYVLQNDDTVRYVSELSIFDGPLRMFDDKIAARENGDDNAKSIGLLIQFNNFKYYVAGDLTRFQEDGCNNPNVVGNSFQPGVRARVNNADNMAGRVLAMKTSHHGANTSSSRIFINQLRPSAAILSVSEPNRRYSHPAARTINVLDGYPETPILSTNDIHHEHPPTPPPPPQRPIRYYLTGYQNPDINPPTGYGGDASETAGNPSVRPRSPGHIKLTVTENQSLRPPEGQIYLGIQAATQYTAQAVGMNLTDIQINTIADKGTVYGTAVAVALAVGAPEQAAIQALNYTSWVGLDTKNIGIIDTALQTLTGGGNANAVSTAATQVDRGARITNLGNGAAEAIGAAMTGGNATAISDAATTARASQNAGNAAGHAAATVYNTMNMAADDAGYAVAAAMGAVAGGATVAQGSAIAAAIAATVAVVDAATTARVTTKAAIAAGMANNLAALAGAVAAASYYEGVPDEVFNGVLAALQAANFPDPLPTNQANAAKISATIPANDLLNLQFQYRDDMGQTKNANIAHCY
jgi:beta-lactamase superfamily II metal-dependent hydrolase